MAKKLGIKSEFTEIGYPAGNKLIRDHMKEMVEIGERHAHIQEVIKSLDELGKLVKQVNSSQAPGCFFKSCDRKACPLSFKPG